MTCPTIHLNAVQVLSVSCVGLLVGMYLKRTVPLLERLNIPAPIIGGLLYAAINLLLHDRLLNIEMDLVLQNMLMTAFFTTIGMSASLALIRAGGKQVVLFLALTCIGALCQNLLGISVTKMLGLDPLLGIIGGSVALTGGPGTALAFGGVFEQRYGVANATGVGVACAMFGIACGGLIGGPIGAGFIRKGELRGGTTAYAPAQEAAIEAVESRGMSPLLRNVIILAITMGIGTRISDALGATGIALPGYLGAMIAAAIIRNIDDRTRWFRIDTRGLDEIGDVALSIFVVMAMLSLRLWELFALALPILVLLSAQLVLVWLMCKAVFRLMGRDYEAAVMSAGFCGFMLGTAANAMASMTVLRDKFGAAPRAFLIVPLVGVSLIDFFNALMVNLLAAWLR